MFITTAWCLESEASFREAIPLELLGESSSKYGSSHELTVLILEGFHLLSNGYIESLRRTNIFVIDFTSNFQSITNGFPNISKYYSRYERNCFLRWIAIRMYQAERELLAQQIWHLDSDVILFTSLDEIASITSGKTFMLQGCPVFVSIANPEWFKIYESELSLLESDIINYSAIAARQKPISAKNDSKLFNESLYRDPIGSDQDMLEYLIGSKKLMQELSENICNSCYYYIQNPLSIKVWHELQSPNNSQFQLSFDNKIVIGPKFVPFMHYQNGFVLFLEVYFLLKRLKMGRRVMKNILSYRIHNERMATTILFRVCAKYIIARYGRPRRNYTIGLITKNPKKYNIAELFNEILL